MRLSTPAESDADADGELDPDHTPADGDAIAEEISAGVKRKFGDGPEADNADDSLSEGDDDVRSSGAALVLKVNPDGTVDQEDTVKCVTHGDLLATTDMCWTRLWEPGYKERYYRQKFGIELTDIEFRKGYVYFFFFSSVFTNII
jgi:5'-3' exoribonuclease 2